MAIVAATIAAARNLFFIGARRKFSSVPKGMLVSAACQWRAKVSRGGPSIPNNTAQQALILPQKEGRIYTPYRGLFHAQGHDPIDGWGAARWLVPHPTGDKHPR